MQIAFPPVKNIHPYVFIALQRQFPWLAVEPLVGDFTAGLDNVPILVRDVGNEAAAASVIARLHARSAELERALSALLDEHTRLRAAATLISRACIPQRAHRPEKSAMWRSSSPSTATKSPPVSSMQWAWVLRRMRFSRIHSSALCGSLTT
jgi:hypothetical protein